ncbi:TetR family transcriptional regulator C-terminal domain-containing protein [Streptomyces tubercidicus]|uniref:TetR family transcriptional regulator C-terminal domain-containing protein n=1 Tax=Streptomyces tubercidicus TaxID=47759 RepID=UPI0036BA58DC
MNSGGRPVPLYCASPPSRDWTRSASVRWPPRAAAQLAFATRAAHHPGLGAIRRQVDERVRTALGDWLASAGHGRGPDVAADRLVLADAVIALSDGLALRLLYAPDGKEALLRALDHALDALIPSRSPSAPA